MNPNDAKREEVFAAALELSDPDRRRRYLEEVCGGNQALREDVESLLAAYHQVDDVSDSAAVGNSETLGGTTVLPAHAVAPRSTGSSLSLPTRFFRDYELIDEIARGGMGIVYRARQISLNRPVAIKMILAGCLAGEKDIKRFRLEAEAAARLVHPNIVSIYEVGEHDGQHYFSMRYIEGQNLQRIVESGSWKLDEGQAAAQLIAKVARAVEFAHEHGVIHRDLKPGNILIDVQGEPHITDFGLARLLASDSTLTLSGSVMGTPSFMAPEQAAGKFHKVTATADVYSLGAVLYYLLTGRPPFVAESPLDILLQVLDREALQPRAINPKVLRDLERICLRCLEKSPERRYPSAAALAEDLERVLRGEPCEVRLADARSRLGYWARRQPALASRLIGLGICATISHLGYEVRGQTAPDRHLKVMGALALWALACLLCQWALGRPAWANVARRIWAAADIGFVTMILHIDDALESPLVALYPALVAASGLWFQVALVKLTTQLSLLGYGSLVVVEFAREGLQHPHWHFIFLSILALTGLVVAYHVHRVSVLGRFCEWRSGPPGTGSL